MSEWAASFARCFIEAQSHPQPSAAMLNELHSPVRARAPTEAKATWLYRELCRRAARARNGVANWLSRYAVCAMSIALPMWTYMRDAALTVRREWRLLRSSNAANYYQNMGFDLLERFEPENADQSTPLWLNYGYWKDVDTQDHACRQLADLVAEAARMGSDARVLDCGFGFAEQDMHWLATRNPAHITGINVTPMHIEIARARLEQRGLSDRMTVQLASATELPFADESFDCVVALESAFHFNTRERFFAEAFRVLKPGGWLATADVVPLPGDPVPPWRGLVLKRFSWPAANCYDRNVYAQKLAKHGYTNIGNRSIRDHVFPGFWAYYHARRQGAARDARVSIPQSDFDKTLGMLWYRFGPGIGDYVLMSGQKPAA